MVEEIKKLHEEMRSLILESGVSESRYDSILKKKGVEVLDILKRVKEKEYKEALEIKSLLPQEIWDRYIVMGMEDLREQVLLAERLKLLKKVWYAETKSKSEKSIINIE